MTNIYKPAKGISDFEEGDKVALDKNCSWAHTSQIECGRCDSDNYIILLVTDILRSTCMIRATEPCNNKDPLVISILDDGIYTVQEAQQNQTKQKQKDHDKKVEQKEQTAKEKAMKFFKGDIEHGIGESENTKFLGA